MDELASSRDSKQTRSNVSFFHALLSGLLPEGTPTLGGGFLLQIIRPRKYLTGMPIDLYFISLQILSSDN